MEIFTLNGAPKNKSIKLETAKGNPIDNYQVEELSFLEINQFADYKKEDYPGCVFRCNPTPLYNCHGLTFASKRTNIDKASAIKTILKDDGYNLITENNCSIGDIVLYIYKENGDIAHSGMVIEATHPKNNYSQIFVLSKWGKYKEVIHHVRDVPYEIGYELEYYRLIHDKYAV